MRTSSIGTLGILAALTLAAGATPPAAVAETSEAKEVVAFYPSFLTWDAGARAWRGEIRGKIYRRARGVGGRLTTSALRATLGAVGDLTEDDERIFRARADEFAVDAKRGRRVAVEIGDRSFVSRRSQANGHFLAEITLGEGTVGEVVPFRAMLDGKHPREFAGTLRLLGPTGLSVISDIDDTVKVSNVLDRTELVANTFYRPYLAVQGMPGLYGAWRDRGVVVHYVTAGPWQLFSPIWSFLTENGLAGAGIEMREFRLANASFVDIFRDSQDYKKQRIREILRRFPERRFVLVGDSGERDPEVYAAIAREFPAQVAGIYIRAVLEAHRDRSRYRLVFDGIDASRWIVFDDAATLPRDLAEWCSLAGS
jgi:phosphatidate phosphatase APP1